MFFILHLLLPAIEELEKADDGKGGGDNGGF